MKGFKTINHAHLNNPNMYCSNCNFLLYLPIVRHEKLGNLCQECYTKTGCSYDNMTRNLTLETYIMKMKYPCKFRPFGCNFFMPYPEVEMHMKYCMFKRKPCPIYGNCPWFGSLKHVVSHFEIMHRYFIFKSLNGTEFLVFLKLRNDFEANILLTTFYGLFILQVCKTRKVLYYNLCEFGKPRRCTYFKFKVEKMFYKDKFNLDIKDAPIAVAAESKINYINKKHALKIRLDSILDVITRYGEAYLIVKLYDCYKTNN